MKAEREREKNVYKLIYEQINSEWIHMCAFKNRFYSTYTQRFYLR